MMIMINYHQELHMIPTYENCIRSEIHASPGKIFLYFILPIVIAFCITLFFDSNILQIPYSHVKDIYSAVFAQTSIKSSVLTFLILICMVLVTFLTKWLQLSVNGNGLMVNSFILPLLMVKGPCILSWTFRTDVKNLEEAKHNYMVLRFGPKNKPIKMEEISVAGLEINWIVFFLKRKLYFLKLFGMFSSHWCWKNVVWNVCLKKFAYFVIWVEVFLHPCSICRSFFFSPLSIILHLCAVEFLWPKIFDYIVFVWESETRSENLFILWFLHLSRGFPAAKTVNKYLFFPHPTNPHYSATLFLSSLVNGVYGLLDDLSSQPSNCWWCQKVKYIVWVRRDLLIPPTTSAGRITNNKSDHFKLEERHRLSELSYLKSLFTIS